MLSLLILNRKCRASARARGAAQGFASAHQMKEGPDLRRKGVLREEVVEEAMVQTSSAAAVAEEASRLVQMEVVGDL